MTDLAKLGDWLHRYEHAWRSNDPADIGDLFTDDAVYRYHPWEDADARVVGRSAIVDSWLKDPDDPDTWSLTCEPVAVNGSLGVARCVASYAPTGTDPARVYHVIWLVDLDDAGRCREFVEYG